MAAPNDLRVYGLPFASSATSGSNASASGQTGSLTVCADYKSGSTYYQGNTASFTDHELHRADDARRSP